MLSFIVGIILAACSGMVFADRDTTHQLFEYTFLQSECENGLFTPHVFENGSSFGVLRKMGSSECLERSGYRNILAKYGVAAKSEGTFQGILERINQTKEFSVEMWVNYLVSSRYTEKVFLISKGNEMDHDYFEDLSCDLQVSSVLLYLRKYSYQYASFVAYHNNNAQLLHLVFTVRLAENATYATSYINGTISRSDVQDSIDIDNWDVDDHLILSRANYIPESPAFYSELYYIGFYDHALSQEQVIHNFNCLLPPSLATMTQQKVYGAMNPIFPIEISIQDYNLETSTNLVDNYTVQLILLSLPHRGQLYFSSMQPIVMCPPEGIVLNSTTLYYQPEFNEFSESEYSNITLQVENPFGLSNPKSISIFVEWVNQPPVTWDCWFNITTDAPHSVEIDMLDVDGDAAYTRFVSISPTCAVSDLSSDLILNKTQFEVWFIGDSAQSSNCSIQFVVGDSHGLESNITTYWFTAINTLFPELSEISVNQSETTNVSLPILSTNGTLMTLEVELQIVAMPRFGTIESVNGALQYCSQEFYFSSPSTTIYGKSLENPMDSIEYVIIHKSISSPPYKLNINIVHQNTLPKLTLPSELYFKVYESVPVQDIQLIDHDNDTQLCELQISSVSGLFYLNITTNDPSNSLKWISGNYGEGRDNSLVTVEGSLSAMRFALQSLSYKAMYRLNDTLQLQITDGEFVVSESVKMMYVAEQVSVITPKFTIIVALVVGVMVLWALSLCCKICPRKKKLPVMKEQGQRKREHEQEKNRLESELEKEQKQKQSLTQSKKIKKTPPPLPTSLPPVNNVPMNSDEVNINYKKSSKPPSIY